MIKIYFIKEGLLKKHYNISLESLQKSYLNNEKNKLHIN